MKCSFGLEPTPCAVAIHLQAVRTLQFDDSAAQSTPRFSKIGKQSPTSLSGCVNGSVAAGHRDGSVLLIGSDGSAQHCLEEHALAVMGMDFSPSSTQVVSGSRDGTVRVWDVETGKQAGKGAVARNLVTCLKWLPQSSSTFVQGAEDLHVRIWDTRTGMTAPVVVLDGYTYFPLGLDVDDAGHTLATSSKGFNSVGAEVRLWDLRRPKEAAHVWQPQQIAELQGHSADAVACTWLPVAVCTALGRDSQDILATASKDGSVRLWSASSESPLATYKGSGGVAWSCMAAPATVDDGSATSTQAPHLVVGSHSGQLQALRVQSANGKLSILDAPP